MSDHFSNARAAARAEYVYASAKTYIRAVAILQDMFADGDVTASEFPRIVKRGNRFCITLPV